MYELLKQRHGEYRIGVLYREYPTLPVNEAGRVFRFYVTSGSQSEEDAVSGLEYSSGRMTVHTCSDLRWREKQYVLIDGELWRINSFTSERIGAGAPTPLRVRQKKYTLELWRVDAPVRIER